MQRGSRMAQRAIRDGQKLDYITFCRYGEWEPSGEVVRTGNVSKTSVASYTPDYEYHVMTCPWYQGFQKFGALEAGALYCANLDEAINQGFNGQIPFRTVQTMHTADCCIFRVRDAGITPETDLSHREGSVRGFDYHCAHIYTAFGTVCTGIFGQEGEGNHRAGTGGVWRTVWRCNGRTAGMAGRRELPDGIISRPYISKPLWYFDRSGFCMQ